MVSDDEKERIKEYLEENHIFPFRIYTTSKVLSNLVSDFLIRQKQEYT